LLRWRHRSGGGKSTSEGEHPWAERGLRRASLKHPQPDGKPEGRGLYPTDRVLGGARRERARTKDCVPPCVDAHPQSRRQRRDDRGAGRAGVHLRTW
jgi:hypothetical protein